MYFCSISPFVGGKRMSGKRGVREIGKTSKGGTQCSALARGFMLPLTAFFGRLVLGALRLGRMRLLPVRW